MRLRHVDAKVLQPIEHSVVVVFAAGCGNDCGEVADGFVRLTHDIADVHGVLAEDARGAANEDYRLVGDGRNGRTRETWRGRSVPLRITPR